MKKYLALIITFLSTSLAFAQHGKYVGGDISDLVLYENHNSPYLDADGNKIDDLITWLTEQCHWNTFRVRLFVNPNGMSNDGKHTDPSVVQDLEYVMSLGKRIKEAGAQFLLDFHYSDTWVDAEHIQSPDAWKDMSVVEKSNQISSYTKECLDALIEAGAKPDMVQVGNEIMYGFMGIKVAPYEASDSNWEGFLSVLRAGCNAVREACPTARIIIHTDRPSNTDYANFWYGRLDEAGIDYDVIGLSYYPFWHGTLDDLRKGLDNLKTQFPDKTVQIVETGYYFQWWPTSGINYNTQSLWPATTTGQYNFVEDLIHTLSDYPQVEGLYYWCPEDAGNGDDTDWNISSGTVMSNWTNRGLWDPTQSQTGHKINSCTSGTVQMLMKDFLKKEESQSIRPIIDKQQGSSFYTLYGHQTTQPRKGEIYIHNGLKSF